MSAPNWNPIEDLKNLETDPSANVAESYGKLIAQCPVAKAIIPDSKVEFWGVLGHDELMSVLRNPKVMSSTVGTDAEGYPSIVPLFADAPLHTGFRKLLNPNFPLATVTRLEPEIRAFANEMVDEMVAKGTAEFSKEFAMKYPTRVLCRLLGAPETDWPIHVALADAINHALGEGLSDPASPIAPEVLMPFLPYIAKVVADRRANPENDVISSFVTGRIGDRPMEDGEIIRLIIALMLGGHITTASALNNFVLRIAMDEDLQTLLRSNPARIPDALEECLRLDVPHQALFRKCLADTELAGQTIKAGDFLLTNYAAANVDPRRHADPEKFDIDREDKSHLTFGFGVHQCLGQHLARLDIRIAIETLLAKTSSIKLNGPVIRRTFPVLSAVDLPLKLEPAVKNNTGEAQRCPFPDTK